MRLETVAVDELIPIELSLDLITLDYLLNEFDNAKFEPVLGIDYKEKYLLCDGHHRAARAEILNEPIQIKIVEYDFEMKQNSSGFFELYKTRKSILNAYEEFLKSLCDADEIYTIKDLISSYKIFKTKEGKYRVI